MDGAEACPRSKGRRDMGRVPTPWNLQWRLLRPAQSPLLRPDLADRRALSNILGSVAPNAFMTTSSRSGVAVTETTMRLRSRSAAATVATLAGVTSLIA